MSPLRIAILAVAMSAAAAAALLARQSLAPAPPPPPTPTVAAPEIVEAPTVQVLVASGDLVRGQVIEPGALEWAEWPEAHVRPTQITDQADPAAMESWSGHIVRTPILDGEPIDARKLVEKGDTGYMAALLEPGMVAVSVDVDPSTAAGGFILPGDKVDIMITYDRDTGSGDALVSRTETLTVLENVEVLALDQVMRQNELGEFAIAGVATVQLSQSDARHLRTAAMIGTSTLALRGIADAFADADRVTSRGGSLGSIQGPDAGPSVRIIRNGRSESVE